MTDYNKFALAYEGYIKGTKESSDEERRMKFVFLYNQIKDLNCLDFRLFYLRAFYLDTVNEPDEAKANIDKSIELIGSIRYGFNVEENGEFLMAAPNLTNMSYIVDLPPLKKQISDVYLCAGEIYAKIGKELESLSYYKIGQYYSSFLRSEFKGRSSIDVYSFRRYNEHSLSDLINNTITVSPSDRMNDPYSIINLWGNESRLKKYCKEKSHVRPYSDSFRYYRIRSFCLGDGNMPIGNILMWSHYAGEHTGFCVKYRLSKYFICQEENSANEHMYLKKIIYTDNKIDISSRSITSDIAFATKHLDWKYENEVRLIVYNPNKTEPFYGIGLDGDSEIESIFFGCRCPDTTVKTIKNIFDQRGIKPPQFYMMNIDDNDVYSLKFISL